MTDKPLRLEVVPGQKVAVVVPPEAGFPIDLQIGNDRAHAWVDKERRRSGRPGIDVVAWRHCPDLPAGVHDLVVHDARGTQHVGLVNVTKV